MPVASELRDYLRTRPVLALVGATNDRSKFGNIILRDMLSKGFTVVPVNRRATAVDGLTAYANLADAAQEHEIGLVVYVVPPKLTLESLGEAKGLGLNRVWVQPGAGNGDVSRYLEEEGFHYLMNDCVMVRV